MRTCQSCGKETSNPKYCSRSCAAIETNKTPKRKRKLSACIVCNSDTGSARRSYCADCGSTRLVESRALSEVKGRRRYQAHSQVRNHARNVFVRDIGITFCEVCGYDKHYEVCHIKAISDFSEEALVKDINNVNNLIALCPNCHWEFDHGFLEISSCPRNPTVF